MSLWTLVLLTAAGCYAFKITGFLAPERTFSHPQVRRLIELLPVALLASLVVVQAIANGSRFDFDTARLVGFGVGCVAVWRRAPFIVVVAAAAVTTAVARLL